MCRPVFWSTSCDGDRLKDRNRFLRPVARRFRRLAQHQLRQRADDAALLGDGDEDGRRNDAEIAVVQRASVSKPMARRFFRSTIGWKCGSTSPADTARRSACSMRVTRLAASSISRVKTTTRPRPERLAW